MKMKTLTLRIEKDKKPTRKRPIYVEIRENLQIRFDIEILRIERPRPTSLDVFHR